jgi:hypothetical protein
MDNLKIQVQNTAIIKRPQQEGKKSQYYFQRLFYSNTSLIQRQVGSVYINTIKNTLLLTSKKPCFVCLKSMRLLVLY